MLSTPAGISILCMALHLQKDCSPIDFTLDGNDTAGRLVQSEKASSPIATKPSGKVSDDSPAHS